MTKKMNKKTRNVISGILVSIAAIFAVINFADIPVSDVKSFILSTVVFFSAIVLLAFIAVSLFKLLMWIKNSILSSIFKDEDANTSPDDEIKSALENQGAANQEKIVETSDKETRE